MKHATMKYNVKKQNENSAKACFELTPSNSGDVIRSRRDTAKAYIPTHERRPDRKELKGKEPPKSI
jgi:hypothetical protein